MVGKAEKNEGRLWEERKKWFDELLRFDRQTNGWSNNARVPICAALSLGGGEWV